MTVAAVIAAAGTAVAALSPNELHQALLASRYRSLPKGFSEPKVSLEKPSRKGQVGVVVVEVTGPDPTNLIRFSVYRTQAFAASALRDPKWGKGFELVGRAPGWGKESVMVIGSITGKNLFGQTVTNGVTLLAVLRGNVIVQAVSTSGSNPESGDVLTARRLLAYAVRHLDSVRRS